MTPQALERRRHVRRAMQLPVALYAHAREDGGTRICLGRIRDASPGGIRVEINSRCDLKNGATVFVYAMPGEIHDGYGLPVEIRAEVVWLDKEGRNIGMKVE